MTAARERPIWQVSGGPTDRPYCDLFLRCGIALIGPGDVGPWRPGAEDIPDLPQSVAYFAQGPSVGDTVILRCGVSTMAAVGIIASDYLYLTQFDDVRGWDLQHARRVRWFELPEPHDFGRHVFRACRFSQVWDEEVKDHVRMITGSSLARWKTAPLPALPEEEPELVELPPRLGPLIGEVHDLLGLYWGADYPNSLPAEDETVAHVVVPFLKAIGWRSEHIAIKWRDIDVALLDPPQREPGNVRFVIEAKRLGYGLEGALDQAKGYVTKLDVPPETVHIIVTDGIRYRLYVAGPEGGYSQAAYANFERLKLGAAALFGRLTYPPQGQGEQQ